MVLYKRTAQHSVLHDHEDGMHWTLGALRGFRLVPAKWRYLVPEEHRDGAQSRLVVANSSCWLLLIFEVPASILFVAQVEDRNEILPG